MVMLTGVRRVPIKFVAVGKHLMGQVVLRTFIDHNVPEVDFSAQVLCYYFSCMFYDIFLKLQI